MPTFKMFTQDRLFSKKGRFLPGYFRVRSGNIGSEPNRETLNEEMFYKE